ncbi:unnamed protein product [Coregonus sp. 'balchen']|nr:unnamed protein product [Coregonus sp. 'balchen']
MLDDRWRGKPREFQKPASVTERSIEAVSHLSARVIIWPTGARAQEVISGHTKAAKFPGVIGAIDGTHIPIKAPREYPETYNNQKSFHSMKLQAVTTTKMLFTSCMMQGCTGTLHQMITTNPQSMVPNDTHILVDPAYPLQPWLLVPFKDNGHLSGVQKSFNNSLCTTRCTIEKSFAHLKGRFRHLKYLDMNRTGLIPLCILACCVLHNICLCNDDTIDGVLRGYTCIEKKDRCLVPGEPCYPLLNGSLTDS